MDHPDVRQARMSDQDAVADLWMTLLTAQSEMDDRVGASDDARERWENDFPMWLDDETARLYVVENEEGSIVGFASARRWGPAPIYEESSEVYLDELYVRPESRRQGYGTQLVRAVRHWADQIGAQRVRLRVLTSNADGRAFWASQDAIPLSMTLTIEGEASDNPDRDEGSEKIGFSSERNA
ncbi:GNAT family N-acetyltransferase [Salinibacter sp. 10B]|uniref:GNAT family N-acetyltransferase n=1 Tax=Salinibacter sp. 10B TaxID=1923971 RepID=UPI000D2D81D8|nr:GNAT family N-acetyltransferase [Salinibacter sp. 10B]